MAVLFLFLCLPGAVLLPIYHTGSNKSLPEGNELRTIGIQTFSLSNVDQDDSWRFWITIAMEFVVFVVISVRLITDFTFYIKERRRYRASVNPANYAILVQDIPKKSCHEEAIYQHWNKLFPQEVERVYVINDGEKLVSNKAKFWNAVKKRERAEWDMEFSEKLAGAPPQHKIGFCSCCRGKSALVPSIDYWSDRQNHYATKIATYQQELPIKETPPTSAAIVVFTNRRAAALAAQANFPQRHNEWRVSRAPEPNAVNWKSLKIPGKQMPIRTFLTIFFSMLLTLFWIIPVTFIMSLANLQNLAELEISGSTPFSFLENVANWSPVVTGLIESLLPAIILSVFLSLIPTFLRIFVNISRVPSNARVDNLVRDWYFNFVVFSNFLFVIVAGSLLEKLVDIVEEPTTAVEFLAQSAPKQASFIMNFILLKALSETPKEILQIGRVVVRWVMRKFLARTPREKDLVDTGNTIFNFFRYYAIAQLVALLGIIYSTIAPFILPICFAYFAISYIVWKYNLCYSMHNPYQDGGSMYGGALYGLWTALFLHFLTSAGILGLNKNPIQTALMIIPIVASILLLRQCRTRYSRISAHGSLYEVHLRVDETNGVDEISKDLAEKYAHPGFEPLPDPVENLNGIGDNTLEEKHVLDEEDIEDPIPDSIHEVPLADMPLPRIEDSGSGQLPSTMSTEDWKDAASQPGSRNRFEPRT